MANKKQSWEPLLVKATPPSAFPKIVKHSHFNDPIERNGRIHGFSRHWGDVSIALQPLVIESIIYCCRGHGMTLVDTAHILSIIRHESGWNPDAANPRSSASGLGQFIDKTRKKLAKRTGCTSKDPFDMWQNLVMVMELYSEALMFSHTKGGYEYLYAYWHDGPSLQYGGLDIAKRQVIPQYQKIKEWLKEHIAFVV